MVINDKKPDNSNRQKLIIIAGAVIILAIVAGLFAVYTYTDILTPKTTESIENKPDQTVKNPVNKIKKKKKKKKKLKTKETSLQNKPDNKTVKELSTNNNSEIPVNKEITSSKRPVNESMDEIIKHDSEKRNIAKKTQDSEDENSPLNMMPPRQLTKRSAFSNGFDPMIQISEKPLKVIKNQAIAYAGKINPFYNDNQVNLTDLKDIKTPKMPGKLNNLPRIPDVIIPPQTARTGLDIFPPSNNTNIGSMMNSNKPSLNNKDKTALPKLFPDQSYSDNISLSGIIGSAAVLNINGQSKALHTGQNYQGVMVLSVMPRSAVLRVNGKKVVKELRD